MAHSAKRSAKRGRMKYLISSDWHMNPGEPLFANARSFLAEANIGDRVVLAGDIANLLPHGLKAWGNCRLRLLLSDIAKNTMADRVDYIAGNHDPQQWLYQLLGSEGYNWPLRVADGGAGLIFGTEGEYFNVRHGHERSDWALLQHIAPQVVEWMVWNHPQAWYRICRQMKWLPGNLKDSPKHGESERFTAMTQAIHAAWERYAEERMLSVIIGHTHKAVSNSFMVGDELIQFMNCGDLREGTYVKVENGIASLERV